MGGSFFDDRDRAQNHRDSLIETETHSALANYYLNRLHFEGACLDFRRGARGRPRRCRHPGRRHGYERAAWHAPPRRLPCFCCSRAVWLDVSSRRRTQSFPDHYALFVVVTGLSGRYF